MSKKLFNEPAVIKPPMLTRCQTSRRNIFNEIVLNPCFPDDKNLSIADQLFILMEFSVCIPEFFSKVGLIVERIRTDMNWDRAQNRISCPFYIFYMEQETGSLYLQEAESKLEKIEQSAKIVWCGLLERDVPSENMQDLISENDVK